MSAGGRQDGRSNLSRAAAVKASYKMTPTIKDAEFLNPSVFRSFFSKMNGPFLILASKMCHYVNNHCKCEKCEILDIHWLLGPIAVSDDCEVMMGAESLLSAMKLLL